MREVKDGVIVAGGVFWGAVYQEVGAEQSGDSQNEILLKALLLSDGHTECFDQ